MKTHSYRYRTAHALFEKALNALASIIPQSPGGELPRKPRRILIIKFGGMGEAVLARSLVEHLRKRNPGMSFDFLVEPRTAEMMTSGMGGRVFLYTPQTDGIAKAVSVLLEIRRVHYDAVLDFEQTSFLTAAFSW